MLGNVEAARQIQPVASLLHPISRAQGQPRRRRVSTRQQPTPVALARVGPHRVRQSGRPGSPYHGLRRKGARLAPGPVFTAGLDCGSTHAATSAAPPLLVDRVVIVTERMDMHLVWTTGRIFLKPIPRFLLELRYWEEYLPCPLVNSF
ncbi:hypothetical protein BGZ61DRAFT_487580 [Ilyonectria robusta]|uniref:uncharacterized protein n=1 Tax=Ilyonectria robusta TaxID=1079257 RepID=UPI001E8DE4E0|nr:uncharacterized protein BGZ61DRAFT_487580 [Ilyonectria robusta]KAH8651794.1 hypothetical protein BGZ61DRAFT_487580 [Ilyonectria robusta]